MGELGGMTKSETSNDKKRVRVDGYELAYVERGRGAAVVFLHGNPTSSYLWREMIAGLEGGYRCLAPDLIGMGDSEKLREGAEAYSYERNQRFVDGWFDAVVPMSRNEKVVLVVHDWGGTLGLEWARRHPARVRGVAYMETIMGSIPWAVMPPPARAYFEALRGPAGEQMVLADNVFVEGILAPGGLMGAPSEAMAAEVRRPFLEAGEGRRPTLSWPRLLPFDGEPREMAARIEQAVAWFGATAMPKLFVDAEPGRVLVGGLRERARGFANQTRVVVPGLHYPQEDSPREVTQALREWLATVEASAS
jgi:haloalkane dehalogenase